jgi:hypothetical protein
MFRGSVKNTGYPLHSPLSPSLPLPCVTVCHHVSTGLYLLDGVASAPLLLVSQLYLKARTMTQFAGGTVGVLMSTAAATFDEQSHTTDNE